MSEPTRGEPERFKRGRGARASDESEKRSRRLPSIQVSDDEYARIHRMAAERHLAVGAFVRDAALSVERGETSEDRKSVLAELRAHRRLFYQASNNLNQIARATNATGEWQPETQAVADAMLRFAGKIDADLEAMRRA